jgi:limonene-1,2-epoxide hydrolase
VNTGFHEEQHMIDLMSRRDVLAVGGLSLLASAVVIPTVEAKTASPTALEQANIQLVKQFLDSLGAKPLDFDSIVAKYFAPDASVRWIGDAPPAIGAAAAIAAAKPLVPKDAWLEIKLLDIWARGPLVTTSRIDIMKVPGKPDMPFDIAGVHVIKDGKIVEYIDYVMK